MQRGGPHTHRHRRGKEAQLYQLDHNPSAVILGHAVVYDVRCTVEGSSPSNI